ncbi:uncharacterized protein LOC128563375 [Nycticebus coucang]|uniref:uncharacterized protein LOC128563375 n=1 Tax=Nycticebus coucang TaxID=9470 RepID=UPI00234D58F5|nr:uncharacterized protein LOC128563375 [Nycticebus coucang]
MGGQLGLTCTSPFQIVLPFFSLLIKDIYFLNEGCANRLPNGHVNFETITCCSQTWLLLRASRSGESPIQQVVNSLETAQAGCNTDETGLRQDCRGHEAWELPPQKFLELAKQIGEFITWKQMECPFEQDPSITHYLHTTPIFSEDGLYLASYESESPENQTEKERWKSLRSSILGKTREALSGRRGRDGGSRSLLQPCPRWPHGQKQRQCLTVLQTETPWPGTHHSGHMGTGDLLRDPSPGRAQGFQIPRGHPAFRTVGVMLLVNLSVLGEDIALPQRVRQLQSCAPRE